MIDATNHCRVALEQLAAIDYKAEQIDDAPTSQILNELRGHQSAFAATANILRSSSLINDELRANLIEALMDSPYDNEKQAKGEPNWVGFARLMIKTGKHSF